MEDSGFELTQSLDQPPVWVRQPLDLSHAGEIQEREPYSQG